MKTKLEHWSPSHQLAQVVDHMFADLEAKGVLRSAPEEFNLAAHANAKDELNAEFIRTFVSQTFPGFRYLDQLKLVQRKESVTPRRVVLPQASRRETQR